jgi:predicted O-linked N-acetylglucosamine transferase (SPINDLY family)
LLDEALTRDPTDFAALAFRCNVAQRSCDFDAVRVFEPKLIERARSLTASRGMDSRVAPFLLLACDTDAATIRDYSARYYRERITQTVSPMIGVEKNQPINGRRLRVGYLTGDFHGHAVSILTAGMFDLAMARVSATNTSCA